MKPKKVFITYGTKDFYLQKKHLINLAEKSDFFDYCISYSPQDLNSSFTNRHKDILEQKKGGGFWIWKYQIIKQTIENLNMNDFVIYSDSGSSLNLQGKKRYLEYIDMLYSSEFSMLRFKLDYIEKFWTTKEIFDFFKLNQDSSIGNSKQFLAGHILMKKTASLVEQLETFNNLIEHNNQLITNKYDQNQIEGFVENRNDQSIFSLISKIYGCVELNNEVWFEKEKDKQYSYPFLAVQQKKYTSWEKTKFYSNYDKHLNSTIFFGEKIYLYQKPSLVKRFIYKLKKIIDKNN